MQLPTKSLAGMMAVTSIAILFGGWMGQAGLYTLTLTLPLPIYLISFVAVLLMHEPESSKKAKTIQESNYARHIGQAVRVVTTYKGVLLLAVTFAVLEGVAINMKWYYPAIFESLGFGLGLIGTIMSLLYVIKSVGGIVASKMLMQNAFKNSIIWVGLIAIAWIVSSIIFTTATVIPALIVILLGTEIAINSIEELIHDQLDSGVRATAMSFVNLLSSVAATLLLWSWGGILHIGSINMAMLSQGVVFGGLAILLFAKRRIFSYNPVE